MRRHIITALLATTLLSSPAIAKVGVASVVNGEPLSKPPSEVERVLNIGSDLVSNEVVNTKANDRAQLVFLDGSSLTIGPNSGVVIDRFVYDTEGRTGSLSMSATKGVFRYVGGAISKSSEVTIRTPSATIGIRGGIATVTVQPDGQTTAGFLFGGSISITSQGVTRTTTQAGTQIVVPVGLPPAEPTPIPPASIQATNRSLQASAPAQGQTSMAISQAFGSSLQQVNSGMAPSAARAAIASTQQTQMAVAKTPSTQGAGPLQAAGPLQGNAPMQSAGPLAASGPTQASGTLQNAGPLAAATPFQQTGPIATDSSLALSVSQPALPIPNAPALVTAAMTGDAAAVQQLQSLLSTPAATTPAALTSLVSSVSSTSATTSSTPTTTTTTTLSTTSAPTPLAPTVYSATTSSNLSPN